MIKRDKNRFLVIAFFLALFGSGSFSGNGQSLKDSSLSFPMIGIQYSFDIPAFDLAKSFGVNSTIGASYWHKTTSNWLFGFEYNYVFGDLVKVNPLDSIMTSQGYIINN